MQNKKAIEPVIATVLMIVVTIAVVALVIAFVVPFVQKSTSEAGTCLNARLVLSDTASCYDEATNKLVVKMSRGSETFEMKGFLLKLTSGTTTKTQQETAQVLTILGEKTYLITGYNSSNTAVVLSSVAVAPIVVSGTGSKICDVTSTITIAKCSELGITPAGTAYTWLSDNRF